MLKAMDYFCGAGGWSLALRSFPGWDEVGFDIDKSVLSTRKANGFRTVLADVTTLQPETCDLFIASPPCQPFSQANWKAGVDKEKMALTYKTVEHALFSPRVVMEQVKRALPELEEIAKVLKSEDYSVWTGILNAEQYGTPQARQRAVLIASSLKEVGQPTPTHSKFHRWNPTRLDPGVKKWVSMAEGLWFRDDLPQWAHERPSTTIVGSFKPQVIAAPGYRTTVSRQNAPNSVIVSPMEAGLLQDFPLHFQWVGSNTTKFRQIGNAIPVNLAKAILREVI